MILNEETLQHFCTVMPVALISKTLLTEIRTHTCEIMINRNMKLKMYVTFVRREKAHIKSTCFALLHGIDFLSLLCVQMCCLHSYSTSKLTRPYSTFIYLTLSPGVYINGCRWNVSTIVTQSLEITKYSC